MGSSKQKNRFAALIEPQLGALYSAAFRLCRDRSDAEDLVQDVCLRAFSRLDELERVPSRRAWLLRIEYNMFVDRVRRDRRSPVGLLDDGLEKTDRRCSDEPGPDLLFEGEQLAGRLNEAWPSLTVDQQGLLALYAEGYNLAELGDITGLPCGALKARLHRARVRLGKLIFALEQCPRLAAASGESK